MKKSILLIACAMMSMSIFAQTPAASTSPTKHHSAKTSPQVKKDEANTKAAKESLAQDKSKEKSDAKSKVSSETKKKDKDQVKKDKAAVSTSKQTEKNDKKAVATKKVPSTSTGSLSKPPKQ